MPDCLFADLLYFRDCIFPYFTMSKANLFRYFIHLAYDGTNYHGWQIQPNSTTVQQVLDNALSLILRTDIQTIGCGRTDSGVHAVNFYSHFNFSEQLNSEELELLTYKLNSLLPKDIVIYSVFNTKPDAHARFSATSRTYKYYISRKKNPFRLPYTWYYPPVLDFELMKIGAKILFEYDDFAAFSKKDSDITGTLCKLEFAFWEEIGDEFVFTIKANRFLRNMVRAITGTLLEMGQGKLDIDGLRSVIESKDRCRAGMSVPASGLFLYKVDYPKEILSLPNSF